MKRWLLTVLIPLTCLLTGSNALAQGQATVLDPISPIEIEPMNKRPVIAADAQGNVMVVFWGKRDDERVLWSLRSSGGAWSGAEVPLPAGEEEWFSFDLYDLAGRNGQFALLLKESHEHYSSWTGGSWSTPVEFPDDMEHPRELGFDASGNLIAWDPGASAYFSRLTGGTWQTIELPQRHQTHGSCPPNRLLLGRTGALHLLGETMRDVLMVGSCPAGADPMQPASWVYQPDGYNPDHTGGARQKHEVGYALDWPSQTLWMAWEGTGREDGDKIFVAHAPIGTTSEAGWIPWEIAVPDGKIHEHYIVSSGAGAVGVAYKARVDGEDAVYFRWLPETGLGQELDIVRPGSQTEAATFSNLYHGTLEVAAAPDGTAHLVIKGKKRGEYPENAERIYYSRITGGAVLQNEPGVQGGGTQIATDGDDDDQQPDQPDDDWQQQGGKPDLQPTVTLDDRLAYQRDGETVYRLRQYHSSMRPEIAIRNLASQYFGDVEVDVTIDGVVVHYVDHDESEHMRPMIERDDELDISRHMPRLNYRGRPEEGWEPPTLELADTESGRRIRMHAPLGRKTIRVVVDPDDKIDEVNEDNNVAELEYEVSGANEDEDELRLESLQGGPLIVGYNDLAILGTPRVMPNCAIASAGLIQHPTEVEVIVGNPRAAAWFEDVEVVALIDGEEISRQTIPHIDDEPRFGLSDAAWLGLEPEQMADNGICGGYYDLTVDLSGVPIGAHELTIMVDPEDKCADLNRSNNTRTLPLRVREPGGTLTVAVRDDETGQGIANAMVDIAGLHRALTDGSGTLTIANVPPGRYAAEDIRAYRRHPAPSYGAQHADAAVSIANGGQSAAFIELERPAEVIVKVLDAATGEPARHRFAWLQHREQNVDSATPHYALPRHESDGVHFDDVPPGPCRIEAGAYAYETATIDREVHRDANGQCVVEVRLQPGPRTTISGTVKGHHANVVEGAEVWLAGAPRSALTDEDGAYTLTDVAAGRDYTLGARKRSYAGATVPLSSLPADTTVSADLVIRRVTTHVIERPFKARAWSIVEEYPGFNFGMGLKNRGVKVSGEFGRFTCEMGMTHATTQGEGGSRVVEVVFGTESDIFWEEHVTPKDFDMGSVLAMVPGVGKVGARILTVAKKINGVHAWLEGDTDYHELNANDEVTGTFTSHTGAEPESVSLIDLSGLDISPGMSGGKTVVRCDRMEITDGATTREFYTQFYTPTMGVYHVDEAMDLDNVEVRFYVSVLNSKLWSSLLGDKSRNLIIWRPAENTIRMEGSTYDPLGHLD